MKYIVTLFPILLSAVHLFAQPSDMPINREPGKCYAKCQLPDEFEEDEQTFKMYIGEVNDAVQLDSIYFSVDYNGDWIYEGAEDELSFEQLDKKANFEKIVFLVSDEQQTDYVEETIVYKKLVHQGTIEWKEILCGNKLDSDVLIKIQLALMQKGYLDEAKPITKFSTEIKTALREYQRDFSLPMGQLDVETLEALGI